MLTAGWPADMLTETARAKTPPEHFFTLCAPLYTEHVWQNITVLQYDNMVNWLSWLLQRSNLESIATD